MLRSTVIGLTLMLGFGAQAAELGDDGLHKQDWFLDSFLELKDDWQESVDEGKNFAVIFEQRGCPYCRELHEVNFAKSEIEDYITENFTVLQLDIWGSREVTDFDGEAIEERDLARKWGVMFTPSLVFFDDQSGAEVFRMPGYFKPFHFISALEYVAEDKHVELDFQRYLQAKFEEYEKRGEKPDVW